MKGFRKIIVDGKIWWWIYGSIIIAYSDGKKEKRTIELPKLTGYSWPEIERGHWKKYFSVTPKDIEKWLKGEIPNETAKV